MTRPVLNGRYQLLDELGRGGMATVFRGLDLSSGREVAVKVLQGAVLGTRRERFVREGQVLGGLRHPGIVGVHDAGDHQGRPYLVMELVEGVRELGDAWQGAVLEQRVQWLLEVAEALGVAHAAGIVHRDIKPSNVLIDREGRARLTDFGVAVALDQERLTRTGQLVGTPQWMAPEAFRGAESTGARSDVWSLGVLLYEALTNRLPFEGDTIHQLMAHLTSGYVTPRTLSREIPRDLETVCMRALETNPFRRYANAQEFAAELRRYLNGEPVLARRRWRRPKLVHLAVLAVAVAILGSAGVLALALTREPSASPEPRPRADSDPPQDAPSLVMVAALDPSAFAGEELPGLEVPQPWAVFPEQDALRMRFNGGTCPELRLPCSYDGVTPIALTARLRVPLLFPENRIGIAFQRWQRDAAPVSPELEALRVDDFLLGADNVEREALYLEVCAVPSEAPFGGLELRAGTQDEVRWSEPCRHALGPLRELVLTLRFDPQQGAQVEVELDGRSVARGAFPCPAQPKGEWLLRVGANLGYAPTRRFGVWRVGGHPGGLGRLDVRSVQLAARDARGVQLLEPGEDPDPRHELGRIGRALRTPEPDYAALDARLRELGAVRVEASREASYVASAARYLRTLSLGARGLEDEARTAWFSDLSSYYGQGASPRRGTLGWLGWRWAHDAACYDPVTCRALGDALLRLYSIDSARDYLKSLLLSGGRNSAEGRAALTFSDRPEFAAQRWTLAWLLSQREDAKARRGLRGELAFQVGALEWLGAARITPEDFGTLTPNAMVSVRFGRALAAVIDGSLERAEEELSRAGQFPLIDDAQAWLERLR